VLYRVGFVDRFTGKRYPRFCPDLLLAAGKGAQCKNVVAQACDSKLVIQPVNRDNLGVNRDSTPFDFQASEVGFQLLAESVRNPI